MEADAKKRTDSNNRNTAGGMASSGSSRLISSQHLLISWFQASNTSTRLRDQPRKARVDSPFSDSRSERLQHHIIQARVVIECIP